MMKFFKKSLFAIFAIAFLFSSCIPSLPDGSSQKPVETPKDDTSNEEDSSEKDENSNKNENSWLKVPSILETYKNDFDYIGIATEYGNFGLSQIGSNKYTATYKKGNWGKPSELYYEEIQNGIKRHANSITLGNEMKPQFLFGWWNSGDSKNQTMIDFKASNGKTIKVPSSLNNENLIYATLNVAKSMGVKMRGHVLVWHSQTPDDFFAENYLAEYNSSQIKNLVSKEEMTARQEWYIKTVLECVANWENANGYGKGNHIILAWDVVNEATADDAGNSYSGSSQNWLRGSTSKTKDKSPDVGGSRWYQIYGDEEFIVNAFRFANAYAPSDVKLCYNDYNEYMNYSGGYKTDAICHLIECIQNGETKTVNNKSVKPRIDAMGMQSHLGTEWPSVEGYETALKKFLEKVDVHVSELDFSATSQKEAANSYSEYFKMFQKYGNKSSSQHKIKNITIWGINNENSWINPSSAGKSKTYPLLFNLVDNVKNSTKTVIYDTGTENLPLYDEGDSYTANDSFWAVINAYKNN